MPSAIDASVGTATANSYVSTAEAAQYADDRLHSTAWSGNSSSDRTRALLQAARRIDQESYAGTKADSEQALAWPRAGVTDRDGYGIDSDVIPAVVKDAQVEIALQYLAADEDPLAPSALDAFENVKVGPIDVTPRVQHTIDSVSDAVRRILGPLLQSPSGSTVQLVRS